MKPHPPAEDFSEEGTRNASSKLGFTSLFVGSRTRMMGSRGLGAASIGWTLAGCVLVGFGAGAWLDKKLGTTYWMPILFLVGVVAGFREMFRTLAQINKAPRVGFSRDATPSPRASNTAASRASSAFASSEPKLMASEAEAAGAPRQRLFTVPPPPCMEQPQDAGQQELGTVEIARWVSRIERDAYGAALEDKEEKSDAV